MAKVPWNPRRSPGFPGDDHGGGGGGGGAWAAWIEAEWNEAFGGRSSGAPGGSWDTGGSDSWWEGLPSGGPWDGEFVRRTAGPSPWDALRKLAEKFDMTLK